MAIIDLARQMGKEIQASEEYKALNHAKEVNDQDEALQDSIGKFNLKRIELSTAMSAEKKDDDKIAELDRELKAIYQSIMQNPNMVAFNNAKQAMDQMMNEVTTILMLCVNGEDPDTCSPDLSGCSGSCATCGGCH
jgi:cell fate (sporulation/competence/biofilm development) regulator YlbF (YheA/YmcA/DUF963 family)